MLLNDLHDYAQVSNPCQKFELYFDV